MTLKGGRLELLNKIRSGVRTLAFFSVLFFAAPAAAIEITAIDFNGDLIGKVIPDGKVVSLDNQLIGNVTADSLIVNFDGELRFCRMVWLSTIISMFSVQFCFRG